MTTGMFSLYWTAWAVENGIETPQIFPAWPIIFSTVVGGGDKSMSPF